MSFTDSEPSRKSNEALTLVNKAETVMPKLDKMLEKLENWEEQIQSVDLWRRQKETEIKIKELEDGFNFANAERESFKEKF